MGSEVEFRDDSTGKVQTVTLVFPGDADIAERKISVLTPVGTALIGMRAGDSITWEARDGDLRRLTVLRPGSLSLAETRCRTFNCGNMGFHKLHRLHPHLCLLH